MILFANILISLAYIKKLSNPPAPFSKGGAGIGRRLWFPPLKGVSYEKIASNRKGGQGY
jgi:hypothetical protein